MRRTLGSLLHPADKQTALARYVNRFTGDHMPSWAKRPMPNGNAYPLQFASDVEWLSNTTFPVKKDGRLAARGDCNSFSTWPNNPELRKQYGAGYADYVAKVGTSW